MNSMKIVALALALTAAGCTTMGLGGKDDPPLTAAHNAACTAASDPSIPTITGDPELLDVIMRSFSEVATPRYGDAGQGRRVLRHRWRFCWTPDDAGARLLFTVR